MDDLFNHVDNMMRNIFRSAFDDFLSNDGFMDDFNDFNSFAMSPFPSDTRPQVNPRDEMLAEPYKFQAPPDTKRDIDLDAQENQQVIRKPNIFSDIFRGFNVDNDFPSNNYHNFNIGKSRTVQIIKRSDGSSEEIVIEKTTDGKETKSVTKKDGDEIRRFITKIDSKSGETESYEEVINAENEMLTKIPALKTDSDFPPERNKNWLYKFFDYWK